MFAKTCAIDDKSVDRYDDHRGHTVYAAVNAMAQKIYQIKVRAVSYKSNKQQTMRTFRTTNKMALDRLAVDCLRVKLYCGSEVFSYDP